MRRISTLISFCLCLLANQLHSREWRSADGKNTLDAAFVSLLNDRVTVKREDGRTTAIPLASLTQDDQQFARAAAAIQADAAKHGLRHYEVGNAVEGGWLCKFGKEMAMQKGKYLFTGEQFFLPAMDGDGLKAGEKRLNIALYGFGQRTYVPLEGEPSPIPAFTPLLEDAVNQQLLAAMKQGAADDLPPAVYEPLIESVSTYGLGLVLNDKGLLLIDSDLIKGAKDITVDAGKDHVKATVIVENDKLGVAVIKCVSDTPLVGGRFGGKKELELGQSIFAVSVPLTSTKKGLAAPLMTKGIVSRLITTGNDAGSFQHDAAVDAGAVGGFLVTEKGEMAGVFFTPRVKSRSKSASSKSTESTTAPPTLNSAVTTQALGAWLASLPEAINLKLASSGPLDEVVDTLRKGSTLVISMQDVQRERPPIDLKKKAVANGNPPDSGAPPPAGWSLSKSGTRHNSKCRFYDASKACQPTDGRPCKTCGG